MPTSSREDFVNGLLCYLGSYVAALTYPSESPSIEWG